MIGLTPKQRALYDFIAARIAESGVAPTYEEMRLAIANASKSHVGQLLDKIEERGYIRRLPNRARAIEIVPKSAAVNLNPEIAMLTDRYAAQEGKQRDTVANEILREWLTTYFRSAA